MTTTKLIKKIDDFLVKIETCSEDNDTKSSILKEFHEQLLEKEKSLKFVNFDIEAYLPLDEIEKDCTTSEEYSENIVLWKQRIKNKIELLETKTNNSSSVNSSELNVQNVRTVKLPRLNIKPNYGDPTFLGGAAANCIKGFTLSEENYDSAIELLKKRFGNTHTLIQLHMNNLLKIPAVYNSRDLNKLRIFFDKVEVQIRNLKSLGIEIDSYCNLLTPIILDRAPRDLVLEFNRKYSEGYKFQDVLTFLESEIQSRERALLVQLRSESFKSGSENSYKNDRKNGSSNSKSYKNYAATANYVASTKKHCVFCNSPDHEFCDRMCRLKVECKFCKSKFHSYVLCENAKNKPLSNDKVNEQNNSVVTQCNSSALKSNILLLTCSVIASAGKDSNSVEIARVLLDNGSERSWITKSLASCLKLNIVGRERLSVYSFGSVKTSERIYEVAKLKLSNINNSESSIEIEVLVTQTITSASLAVPNVNVQNALQQKGLFLADMCNSENEIEVLIGGDVFWGITDKEELTLTDKRIIDRFQSNLKFIQGRYETRLLWKFSPIELGNNFCNAKKRFDELQIILRKDEWLAKEYNKIIEEQERLGIVQECIRTENEYFMPHRPVVRIDKDTTKVRLVFNCSSKLKQNISLNDALECGPNLNANILDIMLNFRKFKIAFNADIEKAFLMISIAKNDRNYLKFIWASNNSEGYKIMQMNRLPFGCTMSNFVLSATIKTHIKKYEDNRRTTVEMLKSSLYVDDLYFGAESVEEAFQLSSDAVSVLKDGGFNLRKLRSNSVELESLWVDQGLSTSECLENCQLKVLMLNWNTKEDSLSLDVKSLLSNLSSLKNTKRCVLQTAAMIFDPMGFLSPFVVRIRCLMQDIWKIGTDWDDELPENLTLKWRKWYGEIKDLDSITVERYFFLNVSDLRDSVEIHIFSDASLVAYGAVAYFRYSNKKNEVSTSFIMSKVRVAPLKKLTLPRLELLGVLVAAKLCKYLSGLFNNLSDRVILWTDSEICLCWIRGSFREWKQFVANRICLIQDLTSPSMWKFCPGLMNPADKLTKGESLSLLKNDSVWWRGPKWLASPSDEWPLQKQYCTNDAAKVELLKVSVNTVVSSYSPVLKVNDFSNFKKLLRVTAWVLRFISKSRKLSIEKGPLSAIELQEAEEMWIKTVQWEVFREEIQRLQKNQQISKSSKIYSLSPYLDETGVLRVRGRQRRLH
ncbi:uncharacterized protein LOC129228560 [Uloborus diversus]|uniref:uncharacterized protein LOC129228560 n=1 Tax=Uloborus diversus TaxID=327109 RepID=UPI002409EFCE|nr:uncharacterized protein LOC129228560 [Uloborus diversus]